MKVLDSTPSATRGGRRKERGKKQASGGAQTPAVSGCRLSFWVCTGDLGAMAGGGRRAQRCEDAQGAEGIRSLRGAFPYCAHRCRAHFQRPSRVSGGRAGRPGSASVRPSVRLSRAWPLPEPAWRSPAPGRGRYPGLGAGLGRKEVSAGPCSPSGLPSSQPQRLPAGHRAQRLGLRDQGRHLGRRRASRDSKATAPPTPGRRCRLQFPEGAPPWPCRDPECKRSPDDSLTAARGPFVLAG